MRIRRLDQAAVGECRCHTSSRGLAVSRQIWGGKGTNCPRRPRPDLVLAPFGPGAAFNLIVDQTWQFRRAFGPYMAMSARLARRRAARASSSKAAEAETFKSCAEGNRDRDPPGYHRRLVMPHRPAAAQHRELSTRGGHSMSPRGFLTQRSANASTPDRRDVAVTGVDLREIIEVAEDKGVG